MTVRFSRAWLIVLATLGVCALLVVSRDSLQARYWAERLALTEDLSLRARYLTALCNAGPAARWATARLLRDPAADVRQMGVVILQHTDEAWAAERLLDCVHDADLDVRELAALALAQRGDERMIPILRSLYLSGNPGTAAGACLALAGFPAPASCAALAGLMMQGPADERRCALVEALAECPEDACIAGLVLLSGDETPCREPARLARLAEAAADELRAAGFVIRVPADGPGPSGATAGARATEALRRARLR